CTWTGSRASSCILRHAVAERPVLLQHFDQVDEHVLRSDARLRPEEIRDARIERLLLRQRSRVVGGDLDDDDVVAAREAEIMGVVIEAVGIMLGDDHEAVALGHVEGLAHGAIDAVLDGPAVGRRLAGAQRDTDEWHGRGLLRTSTPRTTWR